MPKIDGNSASIRKYLAKCLIFILILSSVPFMTVDEAQADTITISGSNSTYTIADNGSYTLASGFSGTINISGNAYTLTISGSGAVNNAQIVIQDRSSALTLNIDNLNLNSSGHGIDIQTDKTVNLRVSGTSQITALGAAIHAPSGKTIQINKPSHAPTGLLKLYSGDRCAGIGGAENEDGGNITIGSGTVFAVGGVNGAGIGGGRMGAGGTVGITGGTVTANGGDEAAGIGSGYDQEHPMMLSCMLSGSRALLRPFLQD